MLESKDILQLLIKKILSEESTPILAPGEVDVYAGTHTRVPYSKDLMIRAIKEGREIGILFRSKNDKYTMKMQSGKYRIIYPVALGSSKKGNEVIRAVHIEGQSESVAIKTGIRSASPPRPVWRLFKTENIKGMWFTGNFFTGPFTYGDEKTGRLTKFTTGRDKSMLNVEISFNATDAKIYQDKFKQDIEQKKKEGEKVEKPKTTVFKMKERPIEQPSKEPEVKNKGLKPLEPIKPQGGTKPLGANQQQEPPEDV